eukprot:UN06222
MSMSASTRRFKLDYGPAIDESECPLPNELKEKLIKPRHVVNWTIHPKFARMEKHLLAVVNEEGQINRRWLGSQILNHATFEARTARNRDKLHPNIRKTLGLPRLEPDTTDYTEP